LKLAVLAPITNRPRLSTLPSLNTCGGGSGSGCTSSSSPVSRSRKWMPVRSVTTAPPPFLRTSVVMTAGVSSVRALPLAGSKL
jgi:hypothetical protein